MYVWRSSADNIECLHSSLKHVSGSVKVYGSISTIAVGALVKIAGKMKAEKYHQL